MATVTGQFAVNFAALADTADYTSNPNLSYNGTTHHRIVGGLLSPTAAGLTFSHQYYNGTVNTTGVCKSKIEIGASAAAANSDYIYNRLVNQTTGAGYWLRLDGTDLNFYKFSDWTTYEGTLGAATVTAPSSGTEIELWKDYSTNQLSVYYGGSIVSALTVTDASYGSLTGDFGLFPDGSNLDSIRSFAFDGIPSAAAKKLRNKLNLLGVGA